MAEATMIIAQPLDAGQFEPFGEVIDAAACEPHEVINYGQCLRHTAPATIDLLEQNGQPVLNIYRARPATLPFSVRVMERHPLSSQIFVPLDPRPYLVVVAPAGPFGVSALRAFIAGPKQGVSYRRGTWHHFCLALTAPSDFVVLDRRGPGRNCDEVQLAPPWPLIRCPKLEV